MKLQLFSPLQPPPSPLYESPVVGMPEKEECNRIVIGAERCLGRRLSEEEERRLVLFGAKLKAAILENRPALSFEDIPTSQFERVCQKIVGNIYLGSVNYLAEESDATTIISLCNVDRIEREGVKHLQVAVDDSAEGFQHLQENLPEIRKALYEGVIAEEGLVFIHCREGRSRSPSVLSVWIHEITELPFEGVMNFLRSIRPQIDIPFDSCPADFGPKVAGKPNFAGLARAYCDSKGGV